MKTYKNRKEVPEQYKWDLKEFFKDEAEYNITFKECESKIKELKTFKGSLKDPLKLKTFLDLNYETLALVERILVYTMLVCDQELGVSKSINEKAKAENLANFFDLNTNFFAPEILSLTKGEFEKIINDESLKTYHPLLKEVYRFKEHTLTENEESIVTSLVNASNHYEDMCSQMINSEHDYGKIKIDNENIKITTTNYRYLMRNKDPKIRKKIRTQFYKRFASYDDSVASMLNCYVNTNLAYAKVHHYKDAYSAYLFATKMPAAAFDTLIKTVFANVKSIQSYYKVYQKALKLDTLTMNDLALDITTNDHEYTALEAQNLILEALKPLGEDYINHFKKIYDNHLIDYMGYAGKKNGGYCVTPLKMYSRILMSFNGDFDSVTTIAHEGGHCVHNQYVGENNALPYLEVSTLTGEVASLTNECLLSYYLMNHGKTLEDKITGASNIINVVNNNLYGAVREGKIEMDFYDYVNKGNSITADYINKLTKKSYQKVFQDVIKVDKYASYSWINRSHYYNNYYLCSYSFAIATALYLSKEIINGNKEVLNNYLKFLKCDNSMDIMDIYQVLGIDLTNESVYQNAINNYDEIVLKLSQLIDERK